ncbi:MAG: hypothetical protein WC829_01825 [Hyphomicrobium sp.]|jgi:hypothetical protein
MADPTAYTISYSFTDYQTASPSDPLPAANIDVEYANISISLASLRSAIMNVRRSDGALTNGIVTKDSLAADLKIALVAASDLLVPTVSTTGLTYVYGDLAGVLSKHEPLGLITTELTALTGATAGADFIYGEKAGAVIKHEPMALMTTELVAAPEATTGAAYVYAESAAGAVIKSNPAIANALDYNVDNTGVADCATTLATAKTAAATAGVPLFIPAGSYLSSAVTYVVEGNGFLFMDAGFSTGVDLLSQARVNSILLIGETPATTPNTAADNRTPISVTINAKGDQHGNGGRFNVNNYSTYTGGNTGVYAAAVNSDTAAWGAALHGETKHGNAGTSIAGNFEAASYGATGALYGVVVNQSASGAATTHPLTGAAKANAAISTAIKITGDRTFGASQDSAWRTGIDFGLLGLRTDAIGVLFNGTIANLIKSETTALSTNCDILLQANSNHGILLTGTYAGMALRVNAGQYLGMENSNTIKTAYGVTASVWGFYSATNERVGFNMSATPGIRIATNQVVAGRKTGWGSPSGTLSRSAYTAYAGQNVSAAYVEAQAQATDDAVKLLSQTVAALITDLHSATSGHGLIGT